jgi:hypothetical protein
MNKIVTSTEEEEYSKSQLQSVNSVGEEERKCKLKIHVIDS